MTVRDHAPTPRAQAIAAQEGYGRYRSSYRVNRARDRHMNIAVLVLPIAAIAFGWMGWRASPWSGNATPSVVGMVLSGGAGLIFLALTLLIALPLLGVMFRGKGARVHVFEHGAVAERDRGNLYAWLFTRATVRYVCWRESREGEFRDRPQLWVTFHVDGETICFDGLDPADRADLPELARVLGGSDRLERIGALHPAKAHIPF